MIQKIVTWRANGKPVSEIADLLNEEYGTRFVSRNISDKIYQMRKAEDPRVKTLVTTEDQKVDQETLSPKDIDALVRGGEREIQTSYDPKDDTFVHQVVRKPLTKEQKSSKDSVLRALGFDPKVTELKQFSESFWQSYTKAQGTVDLSSIRYAVSYKTGFAYSSDEMLAYIDQIKSRRQPVRSIKPQSTDGSMLLIPLADIHYGLSATKSATSGEYNLEIAERRVWKSVEEPLAHVKGTKLGQITLVLGNDFFNADTLSGTTVKGTPQDQVGSLKEIYHRGVTMIVDVISSLSKIAPVTVLSVMSNHDEFCTWAMMVTLEKIYGKGGRVSVMFDEAPRTYMRFGSSLIGFTHHVNAKDAHPIMSSEMPEDWGKSKHKYFFMAHYHKEMDIEDKFGLVLHRLPTISGKSKWSVGQGYVGTEEVNKAYLFTAADGMVASFYVHA